MTDAAAAARMARSRERRRLGLLSVRVELREHERKQLVAMGLLTAGTEADAIAVRKALHRLLDRIFTNPNLKG